MRTTKDIREAIKKLAPTCDAWDSSTRAWARTIWEIDIEEMAEQNLMELYIRLRAQGKLG